MGTKTKMSVFVSGVLVCLGMLLAPVAGAGETSVSMRYAGSGWDTHVDGFVPDGLNVSLTSGTVKGTHGAGTITISAEFRLEPTIDCPATHPRKYALVYAATVLTFADQSQLFGVSYDGWICASNEGQYYGEVSGVYVGGTGRFESATGDFVSRYGGAYLEPNLSFRSIQGTAEGTVGRR